MAIQFKEATKAQAKARVCIAGPAGSGKTYTALAIATALGRVAVIDTEFGSASKYASGKPFRFDVLELDSYHPDRYIEAMEAAEKAGYDVLVIDSLSHAWMGKDGVLELKDKAVKRGQGNSFTAWADLTPLQNRLTDAILNSRCHVVATLRSKMEYVQEKDATTGKTVVRRVGMNPIQRDDTVYLFDVWADMNLDHDFVVTKTRCSAFDGMVANRPGARVAEMLLDWLRDGAPAPEAPPPPTREPHPLEAKIASAGTAAALDALVAEIGRLPVADKDHLRPLFEARMAELRS